MKSPSRIFSSSEARHSVVVFGIWTILVIMFATHSYLFSIARGEPATWTSALWWAMSEWYTWAALTPFILWLAHEYPIQSPWQGKALLIHCCGAVFFSVTQQILQTGFKFLDASASD